MRRTRPRSGPPAASPCSLEDAEGHAREIAGHAAFRLENGKLAAVTVESDGGDEI